MYSFEVERSNVSTVAILVLMAAQSLEERLPSGQSLTTPHPEARNDANHGDAEILDEKDIELGIGSVGNSGIRKSTRRLPFVLEEGLATNGLLPFLCPIRHVFVFIKVTNDDGQCG